MGLLAIGVSALIVAGILLLPGAPRTSWPVWVGAGLFFLVGVQLLPVTRRRISPHGRGSSILGALICVALVALFGPVAADLFRGARGAGVSTDHPLLAKIHILLILGILAFLLARAIYRAVFPPDPGGGNTG